MDRLIKDSLHYHICDMWISYTNLKKDGMKVSSPLNKLSILEAFDYRKTIMAIYKKYTKFY